MKIARIIRDPFVWLIALVVLTPAGFIAFGITTQQSQEQTALNSSSQTITDTAKASSPVSNQSIVETSQSNPEPMSQAEQATVPPVQTVPRSPAASTGPVCDQARKQAAQTARTNQMASEDAYHQAELDKLRLISVIYRKYWDEEMARHDTVVNRIQAEYQAALASSNC